MRRSSVLILILAVALLLSSCGGSDRSKSVADAESYDELTMDYDEADDKDWDNEDEDDPVDEDASEREEDDEEKDKDSYEERYRKWKKHEEWRDKDVDNFKTAKEYADYYHDDYIELYMEQYYGDEDYDEGTMLEQSYLDAMDHWEMNQPWPKPEK